MRCRQNPNRRRAALPGLTVAAVLLVVGALVPAAAARLVLERNTAASATLQALASHWGAEDHASLAQMIAPEGVRIAIGPVPERETLYSPSQSFYFFKNLFQTLKSAEFVVETSQAGDDGQAHAVARWRYRRSGSEATEDVRLVISLVRGSEGWAVTEIRALR